MVTVGSTDPGSTPRAPGNRGVGKGGAFSLIGLGVLLVFEGAVVLPGWWGSDLARLLVLCAAALGLWCHAAACGNPGARWSALFRQPSALLVLLFLGWGGVSAVCSTLPEFSAYELLRYASGGLVFFAMLVWARQVSALAYARAGALALAAMAVTALLRYAGSGSRVTGGAFGDEQLLAAALGVLIPLALYVARQDPTPLGQVIGGMAVLGGGIALLLTGNRTVWLALAVGLALQETLPALFSRDARKSRSHPGRSLALAAAGLAALALLTGRAPAVLERAATLSSAGSEATFRWRREAWQTARHLLDQRPVFGWGIGTYAVRHAGLTPGGRSPREVLLGGASLSESAHNSYLQVGAELGYPGLALFMLLPVTLGWGLVRRTPHARRGDMPVVAAALGALVVQAVSACANPAWEYAQCAAFQWFVFGVAAVAAQSAAGEVVGEVGR